MRLRLAACLVLAAAAARADTLDATLGQPLTEIAHEVQITVEDGVARYRVERRYANRGTVADEASLDIDLPFGGGVTGLRIRARDTWYDGDLMEARAAARLYQELTGFGPFPAKDPALLQWVWPDKVHLQIFPVLPGKVSTVEYTLTVPVEYQRGRYVLSYPRDPGPGLTPATFVVRGDNVSVDGQAVANGKRYSLPQPATKAEALWDGGVERQPGASYVFSRVVVPDVERARAPVKTASIDLDLSHTYRGDLRVELVTPDGKSVIVHDRAGGNANDLRGRYALALPAGTRAAGTWRLVISDHAARDVGTLNRWTLTLDTGRGAPLVASAAGPLFIPDAPEGSDDRGLVTIVMKAPPIDTVAARLGRVVASKAHGFARLELDAAPELRPLPVRAQVVFVVDASRSEGDDGVTTQLALARAYLGHVPDAGFEIVLFRRFAERLVGGFAPAARFDELVAAARKGGRLQTDNGSALDVGLAAALEALRDRPGPKRVVVLSDAELRSTFAPTRVAATLAALPPDTVVHIALPARESSDEPSEHRDDHHDLVPIAAAGHGILLHLDGVRAAEPARLAPLVLGLVRPIRIDDFAVHGLKVDAPPAFDEGTSLRTMEPLADPPTRVTLDGKIWAEPFHRVVEVSGTFSHATAAFVFSEHVYTELDEQEQMTVAMMGQVVSPVTSYIAIEPGTRPSRIGLTRSGGGSGSGYGRGAGGLGGRTIGLNITRPDLRALVEPGVARCIAAHPTTGAWSVSLAVETTRDEIVDVALARGSGPLADCIVEAAWAVRLPSEYVSFTRDHFQLAFGTR
jgi:hypothetical protein